MQLRHEQHGHAAHAASQHAPVEALVLRQRQILAGVSDVLRLGLLAPQHQRAVVVGAGVADAVLLVGVGQIAAAVARVEGKFQHLHPRPAGVPQQLGHARRGIAQILGDELQLGKPALQPVDEIHPRPFDPLAVFGGGVAVGHGPVALQPAEMVDTQHVEQLSRAVDAPYPPAKAVIPHGVPVVQRVAPQLPVGAEVIRRHAGHRLGHELVVQLEELGLGPHVGGIHGHVDGQVADDADVQRVDVVPQRVPLLEEQVLHVYEERHVLRQQRAVFLQRLFLTQPDGLRPFRPGLHAEMALAGHIQRVVRQPPGVVRGEGRHLRAVPLPAPLEGLVQQREPALVDLAVVHVPGIIAPVAGLAFLLRQQPVGHQQLRVDVVGIARVGGKALIRRVAVAGRAEGQHLPVALPRVMQEIREIIGRLAQRADAIGRGQGGHGHQNTTASIHTSTSLLDRMERDGRKARPALIICFSPSQRLRPRP